MKNLMARFVLFVLLLSFTVMCEACRFTVREIGFSVLSQTSYTFVIADDNVGWDNNIVQDIKRHVRRSNIRFQLLNPKADADNPLLLLAKEQGIVFPNAFLIGPEEWMKPIAITDNYTLEDVSKVFFSSVLQSSLRRKMLDDIDHTFAFVISIPGKDKHQNKIAESLIQNDCRNVKDIMPLMPKEVDTPPRILQLTGKDFISEKFLLWSLGFVELPQKPYVVVLYGRGRFMGLPLNMEQIQKGLVYRYLAMIGADCECNLDRKWMLGTQIPLHWDKDISQKLANCLTFDVDNPSILAEMSRILAKETIGDNAVTISYAPESIDLDEAFGNVNEDKKKESISSVDKSDDCVIVAVYITLSVILFITILVSIIILRKKR